ncbi:MAG: helix-turn-helix transcriptional regulator [Rubrivivax sp.]
MHSLLILPRAARPIDPSPVRAACETTRYAGVLLHCILDIVDYGMVLLQADGRVAFANKAARNDFDSTHPLALEDGGLLVRHPRDVIPLREALIGALHKGLQRLLTLHDECGGPVCVAVVPIDDPADPGPPGASGAMLMLGKRKVCDDLSAEAFGRQHKLTTAEARVLQQLCTGQRPAEIARRHGVALSTVRTQIGCMREKTGTSSIGALVGELSRLPPLLSVLRQAA